jgi:RNA polymerase sigma-70 factor (ECF subfamily)
MHLAGQAASSRDGLDIREIAREHYDAVYRFCARRVGPDRAADVAQETFVTVQRVIVKFRGESSIRTWLFGVAQNECRRAIRRQGLSCSGLDYALEISAAGDGEETIVNRELLRKALAELSDEHRDVVLLHEMEGLTYEESAEVLGIPVGTVKSRLHHAFLNLRRALVPSKEEA